MHLVPPPNKPDNEVPFIFTEEGRRQALLAIDKTVKYGKIFFFTMLGIGLGLGGLVVWVVIHFIRKNW
jgi:hypothetical protein